MEESAVSSVVLSRKEVEALAVEHDVMQVYFELSCPGARDQDCAVWDHVITLTAECDGVAPTNGPFESVAHRSPKKTPKRRPKRDRKGTESMQQQQQLGRGDTRGAGPWVGEPGGGAHELWRGVTPFRRRGGTWLTPATAFFPLLLPGGTCTFKAQVGGEHWLASAKLIFSKQTAPAGRKSQDSGPHEKARTAAKDDPAAGAAAARVAGSRLGSLLPLYSVTLDWPNPSDHFGGPDYNLNRTVAVALPPSKGGLPWRRAVLAAIITGHGGCEFQPTSHHFLVSGTEFSTLDTPEMRTRFMLAGAELGCTLQVPNGALPNEHGTWYYGRNGWCDGQDVPPLEWDITQAIQQAGGRGGGRVGGGFKAGAREAYESGAGPLPERRNRGLLRGPRENEAGPSLFTEPSFNVAYRALSYAVGGEDGTQGGCDGHIIMTSRVSFYY